METKANYVLVGLFTVALFAATMLFAWWLRTVNTGPDAARLDIVIQGSVTGLEIGSPVKFNGINVGKVTGLAFDATNPDAVIAQTKVSRNTPIKPSSRAFLGFTGLTGIAHVELEGGSADEQTVFVIADELGVTPAMRADPSALTDIIATAQRVFGRVDNVLDQVEGFVADARTPLTATLQNVERFSGALADNSDQIDTFLANVGRVGESLGTVSDDLETLVQNVDRVVTAVEPERVQSIVSNVETFTGGLSTISDDAGELIALLSNTLEEFQGIGTSLNASVQRVETLLAGLPEDTISSSLENVSSASVAVREAAEDIAGVTGVLDERRGDIEATLTNVAQMAERLNAASVRVDGVLAKVDTFLGEGDGEDLFAEASQTLRAFRDVANTLNSRLDGITANLERFSGRGLGDVQALVVQTQRSITRIEQAITSLEANPERLIFGGEGSVKRFDGRQRR